MKKHITHIGRLFAIVLLFIGHFSFSQNEAGDDKVVCAGEKVKIGGPDKGYCYVWDAAPGLTDINSPDPEVNPTVTTTYKLTVVGPDFDFKRPDEVTVYVAEVKLVSPTTNQKVKFDNSAPGKLEVEFKASVTPDNAITRAHFTGKIKFEIDAIGASTLTWSNAGGTATYSGGVFTVKATFSGLPANNSDFGEKNTKMIVQDCNSMNVSEKIKVYYDALATNHPGGTASDPNWFYYYKNQEGGTDYRYDGSLSTSQTTSGVPGSIRIANNAYSGSTYIVTSINSSGQLVASGTSGIIKYFAYFMGVVAHERQHANGEVGSNPSLDPDGDFLSSSFETGTSKTDPNDKYSARGSLSGSNYDDGEVYAGGPVEKAGIDSADTSKDWASPGTNW